VTLAGSNGKSHVDTAKDVVGAGLAIEESLTFIVTLELNTMYEINFQQRGKNIYVLKKFKNTFKSIIKMNKKNLKD
jgi:hypothetical protein